MSKRLIDSKLGDFKRIVVTFIMIFIMSIFIGSFIYVDNSLRPTITVLAETKAIELANRSINKAVAYIPIGTALKSPILAKYGPQLKVSIEPIGTVSVDFKTSFESAGINQTRHRIYLEAKTQVKVVIPLTTSTKEVKAQIPICETIIVGEVPESYVNVPAEIAPNMFPK